MKNSNKETNKNIIKSNKKAKKLDNVSKKRFRDMFEHVSPFEILLSVFLENKCGASDFEIEDLKDIIWNEQETNLLSRLVFKIAEENPKTKMEEIMQYFNNAWNNFPHKKLNGLSPREMAERIEGGDEDPEGRSDFYELFEDDFPENIRVTNIRDNDWVWEYPAKYQSTRALLASFREELKDIEDNDSDEETKSEFYKINSDIFSEMARAELDNEPVQFEAAIIVARNFYESGDANSALQILENSINSGRAIFPTNFTLGKDRLPWGFTDNRPFLFLLGEYATLTEARFGPQRAIPFYEELIALNPNDNQGIRGNLATTYLKTNKLDSLLELDKKFPEDLVTELSVGALLSLYKLGRLDDARKRITVMKKYFLHVFREILKTEHQKPELLPDRVRVGGDDEAWLYWNDQGTFWTATPGARDFLRTEIDK